MVREPRGWEKALITYGHARSQELFERSQGALAGGVGGNMRGPAGGWLPHPIFIEAGSGPYIYDVDDNQYIDYLAGYGPLILGHRPRPVIEAVKQVLDERGSVFGAPHRLEIEVSERLCATIPGFEQVRFSNSGSEAVMSALRVARVATGRDRVLRFEGHYHGQSDTIYFSTRPPLDQAGPAEHPVPVPGSGGIPKVLADQLVVSTWNDPDALRRAVDEHGDELAAVICEPLAANGCVIEPEPGYLELLRRLTAERGIVLIFDEVKSGFRLGLGGATAYYGVTPDLIVISKAMAAGFPLAAFGGRRDLMELISSGQVWHSATFHTNPMAMAACQATLEVLAQPGFYESLFARSNRLQQGLRDAAASANLPLTVQGVGPLFGVHFADRRLRNYRDAANSLQHETYRVFWRAMLDRGVYVHPMQYECWYVSGAHSDEDIDATIKAASEAMELAKATDEA